MPINITNHPLAMNGYFYLEGDLYKILQHIRASDYLTAWNYDKHGMEEFVLSSVKRRAEPAFRNKQVGEIMNRSGITVRDVYQQDLIPRPKKTYPLGDGKNKPLLYSPVLWSKQDIYNLHDYYMSRPSQRGVKSKPGVKGNLQGLPTRAELRAALEHGTVYYVKGKDGQMHKVWKAEDV